MSMFDKVTEIVQKAQTCQVGVFKIDGKIRSLFHPSKQFDSMNRDYGRYLVGVYDKNATVKMIMEDIKS